MVHCGYAFVLAFSSIYMAVMTPKVETSFLAKINESQKVTYKQIRKERLHIYIKSLLVSFIIGWSYYRYINKDICYFLAITLFLTSLFYMALPKSQYMIDSLETIEQHKALNDLKTQQKNNGITSTLLGLCIWVVTISTKVKCG